MAKSYPRECDHSGKYVWVSWEGSTKRIPMAAASSKDWKHTGMIIDIFTTFFLDHWLLENVCFLLTILVIPFGAPHYLLHCQKVLVKKIKCHYAGKRNLIVSCQINASKFSWMLLNEWESVFHSGIWKLFFTEIIWNRLKKEILHSNVSMWCYRNCQMNC